MATRIESRKIDRLSKTEVVCLIDDFGARAILQQPIVPGDLRKRDENGELIIDADGHVVMFTLEDLKAWHEANVDNAIFDMDSRQYGGIEFAEMLGHSINPKPKVAKAIPVTQVAKAVTKLTPDIYDPNCKDCHK